MDEESIRARVVRLQALATDRAIPPPPIGYSVMLHVNDDETLAHREMATYMERIYGLPYERLRPYTIVGDEDTVVARLGALLAAGVDHLVLLPTGRMPTQTIEQLAAVVSRLRRIPVAERQLMAERG
jgi:alkanesulfonate monooxygenase SsuD/methylene tetrahydromethanopterin reductase-like flavin-dependent oxidoreductase (luciferase family)